MRDIKKILKTSVLILISVILFPLNAYASTKEALENKNVLFIGSYSEDLVRISGQLDGINDVLSEHNILLTTEYLSSKKFTSKNNLVRFKHQLIYKLEHHPPYDLIITSDDEALDFVVENNDLFKDKPVVFFGVNDKNRADNLVKDKRFFGFTESTSLLDTLTIAKNLQPKATRVVGIIDNTNDAKHITNEFYNDSNNFPNLEFSTLNVSPLTMHEINSAINHLDPSTILINLSISNESLKRYYRYNTLGKMIAENSKLPIYTLYEFSLNDGYLGGKVFSFYDQARHAAETAIKILSNDYIEVNAQANEPDNNIMFNYETIKRYQLNENYLPLDAILINKTPSFIEQYAKYILLAIMLLLLQATLIIALLVNIRNRKHTQIELIEQNNHINTLAFYDQLTNYKNRLAIQDVITEIIEKNKDEYLFAFVDIDNFKYINDTFGIDIGDLVIKKVANRLVSLCDNADEFSRYGGDEFLLIKRIANSQQIQYFLNSIITTFNKPIRIKNHLIYTTVSVGAAVFPYHETTKNGLIKRADIALTEAKLHGKNMAVLFKDNMIKKIENKVVFQTQIRQAFINNEFRLVYQPFYKVATSSFYGAEALIRWHSPTLGHVSPQDFIEEAEHMGLINDIGLWILEQAFEFCNYVNQTLDGDISISINISPVQLKNLAFLDDLKRLITKTNVNTQHICFEITESVMLDFTLDNIEILNDIKALGIHIAIDDFGTGYSSLNYFKRLPAEFLKIDKAFIDVIEDEIIDQQIVKFVISLAHKKGLLVTAEGVETRSQFELLKELGCDTIQGYYFSKPLEKNNLTDFFIRQNT